MEDLKTELPLNQPLQLQEFELKAGTTLIEASAGTGKTYTIQYIVLDLLLKGLDLSEILVVTFTEAATKELVERLQAFLTEVDGALSGVAEPNAILAAVLQRAVARTGDEAVKRSIRKAMLAIDQAAIYTIHGFCQRALQENAFAADANFDSELCADLTPILDELIIDFLRKASLEMTLPMPKLPGKGRASEILRKRAKKLTRVLKIHPPYEPDLCALSLGMERALSAIRACAGELEFLEREIASLKGRLAGPKFNAAFVGKGKPARYLQVLRAPESVTAKDLEYLLCDNFKFNKGKDATLPSHPFFGACADLANAKENYTPDFLRCFDSWLIAAFQRVKRERGLITYDDMILNLDRALRQSESLKLQLQLRYRAALVDEFQDTDNRQYAIFQTLFGAGGSEARFFAMIGDPKQSIYGFRGADISAYLGARKAATTCYTLPMNFRSEQSMVDGTNAFFRSTNLGVGVLGLDLEQEPIAFEPVSAADTPPQRLVFAGEDPPNRMYERSLGGSHLTAPASFKEVRRVSAATMAQDIVTLLTRSQEGRVYFESTRDGVDQRRSVTPGDIAVLVDTHSEAAEIQQALHNRGVLSVRTQTGSILQSEEAKDFLYFLLACLDPHERYINCLLVRPLYRKTDREMKTLSDRDRRDIYELFTVLGKKWREGAAVSFIWGQFFEALEIRECLLREAGGERKLTNYLHIAEFAQKLERVEGLSPERLRDRFFESVQGGDASAQQDECLVRLECDGLAVKIMTMHSSKGLEFPIVFLPSLWQKPIKKSSQSEELLVTEKEDDDCMTALVADPGRVIAEASAEILRLGYVAMTRAVHFCVYYNQREIKAPSGSSNHATGWFDQWLSQQRKEGLGEPYPWPVNEGFLGNLSQAQPVVLAAPAQEPAAQARTLSHAIPSSYQITSYSSLSRSEQAAGADADPSVVAGMGDRPVEASTAVPPMEADPSEPDLLLEAFPGGVRTGTCVHEVLERCDFSQPEQWSRVAESVIARNFPDGGKAALAQRVGQVLELLQRLTRQPQIGANGLSADLAQLRPQACIPEMEFYFPVERVDVAQLELILQSWAQRVGLDYQPAQYRALSIDGYLTGSVDLFFTQAGRYTLLDWKTNRPLRNHPKLQRGYDRAGMHEHMCHGRYYLQALIYSVATSAYLRQRLGDRFDWETHIGGFVYCFVRGVGDGTGWLHESFNEAEVLAAAAALGQCPAQEGIA